MPSFDSSAVPRPRYPCRLTEAEPVARYLVPAIRTDGPAASPVQAERMGPPAGHGLPPAGCRRPIPVPPIVGSDPRRQIGRHEIGGRPAAPPETWRSATALAKAAGSVLAYVLADDRLKRDPRSNTEPECLGRSGAIGAGSYFSTGKRHRPARLDLSAARMRLS
jgi:hypothetical protein